MKFFLTLLLLSVHTWATQSPTRPMREVAVILSKEGYYPKSISVFEGERLKFFLTSTIEGPGCLIVESHKVFMAANRGKITEAEVDFDQPGEYNFYCPGSLHGGRVVVLKKNAPEPKRELASEKQTEPTIWTPREY